MAAGTEENKYAGHSFRIGTATTAAQCGIPNATIQLLGRWESTAYLLYVRMPWDKLYSYSCYISYIEQLVIVDRHHLEFPPFTLPSMLPLHIYNTYFNSYTCSYTQKGLMENHLSQVESHTHTEEKRMCLEGQILSSLGVWMGYEIFCPLLTLQAFLTRVRTHLGQVSFPDLVCSCPTGMHHPLLFLQNPNRQPKTTSGLPMNLSKAVKLLT